MIQKRLKIAQCFFIKAVLLLSATATAAIPPVHFQAGPEKYIEIDLDHWARLDLMFRNETIKPERYIPLSELETGMDDSEIAMGIIRQSFSTWLDDQERSSVWKTLNNAAQGLKADIRIQTNKTKHDVKLSFNPVSTKASVQYTGFALTELSFDLDDSETTIEFSKTIDEITYLASHSGEADKVAVRWSF